MPAFMRSFRMEIILLISPVPSTTGTNRKPTEALVKIFYYKKFGAFAQVTKTFFDEKLKLFGSLRWDYNPEFKPKYTPRLAAVYTFKENHNFRFTYQQGYRFPALFEALSYVNNGRVKRVGSLPYINEGLGYLENSYTQTIGHQFQCGRERQGKYRCSRAGQPEPARRGQSARCRSGKDHVL